MSQEQDPAVISQDPATAIESHSPAALSAVEAPAEDNLTAQGFTQDAGDLQDPTSVTQTDKVKISISEAIEVIAEAVKADEGYAWGWICNLAMLAYDAGAPSGEANRRAADFMYRLFGYRAWEANPTYQKHMDDLQRHLTEDGEPDLDMLARQVRRMNDTLSFLVRDKFAKDYGSRAATNRAKGIDPNYDHVTSLHDTARTVQLQSVNNSPVPASSVTRTTVNLHLDEADANPAATQDMIREEVTRRRPSVVQSGNPLDHDYGKRQAFRDAIAQPVAGLVSVADVQAPPPGGLPAAENRAQVLNDQVIAAIKGTHTTDEEVQTAVDAKAIEEVAARIDDVEQALPVSLSERTAFVSSLVEDNQAAVHAADAQLAATLSRRLGLSDEDIPPGY